MPHSEFLRNTTCVSTQGTFLCDLCSLTVEGALKMEIPGVGMRAEGKHLVPSE